MIVLSTSDLTAVLAAAHTTASVKFLVVFADTTSDGQTLSPDSFASASNGTTPVTILGTSVGARMVKNIRVFNEDTVSHTITLSINSQTVLKQTVAASQSVDLLSPQSGLLGSGTSTRLATWNSATSLTQSLIVDGVTGGTLTLTKSGSTPRTITIPDASGTVGLLGVAQTFTVWQGFGSGATAAVDTEVVRFNSTTALTLPLNTGDVLVGNGRMYVISGITTGRVTTQANLGTATAFSGTYSTIESTSSVRAARSVAAYTGTTAGTAPIEALARSRGTVVGTQVAVVSGDTLWRTQYVGDNGTDMTSRAAEFRAVVGGAVSGTTVPGELRWFTTNTSGTLTQGMTLTAAQELVIAGTTASTSSTTGALTVAGGIASNEVITAGTRVQSQHVQMCSTATSSTTGTMGIVFAPSNGYGGQSDLSNGAFTANNFLFGAIAPYSPGGGVGQRAGLRFFVKSSSSGTAQPLLTALDIDWNGNAAFASTTPSTSTTTGALTVAGGAGFAGDINLGGTIKIKGNAAAEISAQPASATGGQASNLSVGARRYDANGQGLVAYIDFRGADGSGNQTTGAMDFYLRPNSAFGSEAAEKVAAWTAGNSVLGGTLAILQTTPSTNSTTGALTVAGDVGTNALWAGTRITRGAGATSTFARVGDSRIQSMSTVVAGASIGLMTFSTTAAEAPIIALGHSPAAINTFGTATRSGDRLGGVSFQGVSSGGSLSEGALIIADADGAWGASAFNTRLRLMVNNGSTLIDHLILNSDMSADFAGAVNATGSLSCLSSTAHVQIIADRRSTLSANASAGGVSLRGGNSTVSTAAVEYGRVQAVAVGVTAGSESGGVQLVGRDSAGAFATLLRVDYSGTTARLGVLGATPVARQSVGAAATDPATTQTLANNLRTALINLGFCQT